MINWCLIFSNTNFMLSDKIILKPNIKDIRTVHCIMYHVFLLFLPGIMLAKEIQDGCGPTLKEFKARMVEDEGIKSRITTLKSQVEEFADRFPLPGFDNWWFYLGSCISCDLKDLSHTFSWICLDDHWMHAFHIDSLHISWISHLSFLPYKRQGK